MDVLRVENLEKRYGRRKVVQNVSMRVGPSEIVGLLGPNGAGKSTMAAIHATTGPTCLAGRGLG